MLLGSETEFLFWRLCMSSEAIKVYGTDWCGDCYRAMYLLEEKHIPYQWIDIDKSESARKLVMELK